LAQVLQRCKKTFLRAPKAMTVLGLMVSISLATALACKDNHNYQDFDGRHCTNWYASDCTRIGIDWFDDLGYTNQTQREIIENCPYACKTCQDDQAEVGGIIAVVIFAGLSSLCVFGTSWLCGFWEASRTPTLALMPLPFVMTLIICLLVPFTLESPGTCFVTTFDYGLHTVPLFAPLMGTSWAGLAVSLVWLYQTPTRTALGKLTFRYFLATALLNTIGTLGIVIQHCGRMSIGNSIMLLSFLSNWVTNILLQKVVITRTRLHAGNEAVRCMQKTIYGEVAAGTVLVTVLLVYLLTNVVSEGAGRMIIMSGMIVAAFVFVILDGIFSWNAFKALRQVVSGIKSSLPAGGVENKLTVAVRIATNNLWLVLLAVLGTSLHYVALIIALGLHQAGVWGFKFHIFYFILFFTWCVDSFFNDLCAIYIGCGATQAALELVAQANEADAVGIPKSDPAMQVEAVPGQVLGRPDSDAVAGQEKGEK